MNTKKKYIAPELSVDTFKMEKGCAISWRSLLLLQQDQLDTDFNDNNQEQWTQETNNFGGNGWDWN